MENKEINDIENNIVLNGTGNNKEVDDVMYSAFGIASFIIGIVSLLLYCLLGGGDGISSYIPIVISVVGLICGVLSLRVKATAFKIIAVIINASALMLSIFVLVISLTFEDYFLELMDQLTSQ